MVLFSVFALKAAAFLATTIGVIGVVVLLAFVLGMSMVRLGLSVELTLRLLAELLTTPVGELLVPSLIAMVGLVLVVLGLAELVAILLFARLTLRMGLALVVGCTL